MTYFNNKTYKGIIMREYLNKIQTKDEIIAVDLDGTLAYFDHFRGHDHVGEPIPKMMERVKKWVDEKKHIVIFTARAFFGEEGISPVKLWLKENGLPDFEITNIKHPDMIEIWDDRAIRVEKNTGEI